MQTIICVYNPTCATIDTSEEDLQLVRFKAGPLELEQASTEVQLDAGIYQIVSTQPVAVTGAGLAVTTVGDDKDPLPGLTQLLTGALSHLSATEVNAFISAKSEAIKR